jgi:uncharacterized protein YkwD
MTRGLAVLAVVFLLLAGFGTARDKKKDNKKDEPKFEISKEEQKILDATNKERAKEKLPALKPNAILFAVARAHSANMAKQGKLDHLLDDKTPDQRVRAAKYNPLMVGENILYAGFEATDEAVPQWMKSKDHRATLLHKDMTEIGIGIARNAKGEYYYTQVFAKPRK